MNNITTIAKRILVLVGVLALIVMVTDFNRRMAELARLEAQKAEDENRYSKLVATEADLMTKIAYATSAAAVDEFAREENHQELAGDQTIILLPGDSSTPEPQTAPTPTPEDRSNWEVWWDWFFFDPSP